MVLTSSRGDKEVILSWPKNYTMKKLQVFSTVFLLLTSVAFAQKGYVRGKVTDGETGETLYGATVLKEGTTQGVISDFDGNYSLPLDAGTHTIVLRFISYKIQTIENIQVRPGEVTTLDFVMSSDVSELTEVVIAATAMRDTELGINTFQRKSANLLDGVSNQTFRNTGDRDLAAAIGRVTGVSIQAGKYVYIRGLGDRYTRTTLNGMAIPGLDPDRNDVQMDIFPTSVIENVIVYKTFSPNLPGDFTGGIVDVETKNFPDEKYTSLSVGFRFNPEMNLESDFLSYQGSSTDWLGFDNGLRDLPFDAKTVIPNEASGNAELETLTRKLQPQLGVEKKSSFLNSNVSFSHGNQTNKGKFTIGYNAMFNYQNNFEHFDDIELGEYTKDDNRDESELFAEEVRRGTLSRNSVLWTGLLAGALKFDNHSFSATLFTTQNGVSEASERVNRNYDETQATLYENILTYSQRSVTTGMVGGIHQLGNLRMEWTNSYTKARTYDPDFRATAISITNPDEPTLNRGDGAGIQRFWRDLTEFNENLKVDFSLPYGKSNKLQFGVNGVLKERDFGIQNYLIDATVRSNVPRDPDYFLKSENIWTAAEQSGTFVQGNYEAPNNFDARSRVAAGYLMTEMLLVPKLKVVYGVRLEKADMFYTGSNVFNETFDDLHTLDELDILPSLNVVYAIRETMNIRAAYSQTLARPSFREKSTAQIYDPITKRLFNGNLDLKQTSINNYDVRLENFLPGGNMISFSLFYKQFDKHIELVTYDIATNNVKPRNCGESAVYGAEFEMRKRLDFVGSAFTGFAFGTNVSIARSEVDLRSVYVNDSEPKTTEYESRLLNSRSGETIQGTRPMGGQSPYLLNAYLNYTSVDGRMNANVSYNVQGESLLIIGVGAVPDVYSQPFHSLNFNSYRNFGTDQKHRISVGVSNILKSERKDVYKGSGEHEAIYSVFRPGRTFSLTYSLRL
jgi:TonB-dependent receptor